MKHLISLIFIIIFNFSAFGQIDASAWRGKTVLVVVEAHPNYDFYKSLNQEFAKNWYLTDSVHFVVDTLIKRDLDSFGEDTVVIASKFNWQKIYTNRNCCSANPYDCLMWIFIQRLEFRNFQNQHWETYVFLFPDESIKPVEKFQKRITESAYKTDCNEGTKIVKNDVWSKEVEMLISQKLNLYDLETIESLGNHHSKYQNTNSIWLYRQRYPPSNFIELIDLKTNRVIEKIELEPK